MSKSSAHKVFEFSQIIAKTHDLGERTIRGVATRQVQDRSGDVLEIAGADTADYERNPVCLYAHDPKRPIGRVSLQKSAFEIIAEVHFPPLGVSRFCDEICALVKNRILRGFSVGFQPLESEPIRGAGTRYKKWRLLELSIVSLPDNQDALIERSLTGVRKSGVLFPGCLPSLGQRLRAVEVRKHALDDDAPLSRRERLAEVAARRAAARADAALPPNPPAPEYVLGSPKALERAALERSAQLYGAYNTSTRSDRLLEIERRKRQ